MRLREAAVRSSGGSGECKEKEQGGSFMQLFPDFLREADEEAGGWVESRMAGDDNNNDDDN